MLARLCGLFYSPQPTLETDHNNMLRETIQGLRLTKNACETDNVIKEGYELLDALTPDAKTKEQCDIISVGTLILMSATEQNKYNKKPDYPSYPLSLQDLIRECPAFPLPFKMWPACDGVGWIKNFIQELGRRALIEKSLPLIEFWEAILLTAPKPNAIPSISYFDSYQLRTVKIDEHIDDEEKVQRLNVHPSFCAKK